MGLATLVDYTPTTAQAIEAHYLALDPRIRAKRAALDAQREARHAVVEALGLKLRTLREELVVKKRILADAIASAAPEVSHGEGHPSGVGAIVASGGFRNRAVREAENARLVEGLQHVEAGDAAAQARWATAPRLPRNCPESLAST